jgi:hypothetical protein
MSWISGALSLAGTAISAYSQYKQGQDAKDVYEYNEALAEYQSQYIKEASELEVAALGRDVGDYVARQRAIQGKSGTVANIGSNADAIARSYREGDIDAALIRWRAGKDVEMSDRGANLLGTQANQVAKAGNINAATTLLGGLSKWDYKTSQQSAPYSVPALSTRQKRLGV